MPLNSLSGKYLIANFMTDTHISHLDVDHDPLCEIDPDLNFLCDESNVLNQSQSFTLLSFYLTLKFSTFRSCLSPKLG